MPSAHASRWMSEIRVVAAYRDLHDITRPSPLGQCPADKVRRSDRARTRAALQRVVEIVRVEAPPSGSTAWSVSPASAAELFTGSYQTAVVRRDRNAESQQDEVRLRLRNRHSPSAQILKRRPP